jgi:4-aminobutyrate aminotransferase-like enzyme
MAHTTETGTMTGAEIASLTKQHTLFEWSAQNAIDPIPVSGAKGCWFWTPEGKRFLDFNSQLMCVNIGHGDERVIRAIQDQAATLAYANPRGHGWGRRWRTSRRATSIPSSSPTAAPKPTRTPSNSRASSPAARS